MSISTGRRRTSKRMKKDSEEGEDDSFELGQTGSAQEKTFPPPLHVPPRQSDLFGNGMQGDESSTSGTQPSVLFGGESAGTGDTTLNMADSVIDTTAVLKKAPAFLQKLYAMLSDPDITDIVWSDDGESFIVTHPENLAKTVLPFYFKHNNFTSFIRQLNMYGFRKFSNLVDGSMVANALQMDALAFRHENFKKDRPDLLANITRKKSNLSSSAPHVGGDDEEGDANVGLLASRTKKKKDIDLDMILNEMNQIKMQQLAISHEIASIQAQNQLMWAQSRDLQIQYNNQKDTVEKILGFLASVFSKKQGKNTVGGASVPATSEAIGQKRKMITEGSLDNAATNNDLVFDPDNLSFVDNAQIPSLSPQGFISSLFSNENTIETNNQVTEPSPFAQVIPPAQIPIPFDIQEKVNGVAQDIELLDDRVFEISNLVGDLNGPFGESNVSLEQDDGGFFDFINEESISGANGKVDELKISEVDVSSAAIAAPAVNDAADFDDFFND